jgi:hypothetical protein
MQQSLSGGMQNSASVTISLSKGIYVSAERVFAKGTGNNLPRRAGNKPALVRPIPPVAAVAGKAWYVAPDPL